MKTILHRSYWKLEAKEETQMGFSHEVRKKMKAVLKELRHMRKLNRMSLEAGRAFNRPHVVREATEFARKLEEQIKDWKRALAR